MLDLLRQAYGATAAWGVGATDGAFEVLATPDIGEEERRRGIALVQLASVDGRLHVIRDRDATSVAVTLGSCSVRHRRRVRTEAPWRTLLSEAKGAGTG